MLDRSCTSFCINVDLQELSIDGHGVSFVDEILCNDTCVFGENVDGDLVGLNFGDCLIGLDEFTGLCQQVNIFLITYF